MNSYKAATFIAICYFLFTFGYIISTGFYHIGELIIILFVFFLLISFYIQPRILNHLNIPNDKKLTKLILTLILIVNIAQLGARLGDASQTNWMFFSAINRLIAGLALILSFTFLIPKLFLSFKKYIVISLIVGAVLIRIFAIASAPNPTTDVFYILRDGTKLLLEGTNPYELFYPSPYGVYIPNIIFHYGPLTPFIFVPWVFLFNDPRYLLILVDLLIVFLIYRFAQRLKVENNFASLVSLIFLYHPLFPFMTIHAWLEPIITLLLFTAIYFLYFYPKNISGGAAFGAILAIKSVYVFPLITFLVNLKSKIYQYFLTISIPIIFSIPFLLSDSQLFLERAYIYVTNPEKISTILAPTNISLSVSAVILKYTGIILPSVVVSAIGIIFALLIIFLKRHSLPMSVLSIFLIFIVLFMFGPFVFVYNFAFLGNILLLIILLFLTGMLSEKKQIKKLS